MKVLTHNGKVACAPIMGGDKFELLNGEAVDGKCVVAEVPHGAAERQAISGLKDKRREYVEKKDIMRDLRWQSKALADVAEGTEVGLILSGRGYRLDIPDDARPNRIEGIKQGAKVAVGPNISPKAWMNLHGTVEAIKGQRVMVKADEGDADRVKRATGKNVPAVVSMPLSSIEVIA